MSHIDFPVLPIIKKTCDVLSEASFEVTCEYSEGKAAGNPQVMKLIPNHVDIQSKCTWNGSFTINSEPGGE